MAGTSTIINILEGKTPEPTPRIGDQLYAEEVKAEVPSVIKKASDTAIIEHSGVINDINYL